MADVPRICVSIVNWRTAELTIDCLRTLAAERAQVSLVAFVVDNASGDGSLERIRGAVAGEGWGDWVRVIEATRNGGFAAGNNVALRVALHGDSGFTHVWLLNPDTLVHQGAAKVLLDFMADRSEVGIVGGRSQDPDDTAQLCCFRFPSVASEFAAYAKVSVIDRMLAKWVTLVGIPELPVPVDWVSGAHMMIRREVIDAIGLLDEGYFLYYEETDFTLRARRAGWTCWHVPQSRIVHLVGQSSGVTLRDGKPRRLPAYWFESRRRYFVLNHGRAYAIATDLAVIAAHLLWRMRRWLQRKPDTDPPHFLGDFLRHSALFNGRDSLAPRRIDP